SKILAYERGDAGLGGLVVLATDNSDGAGDFAANADDIARGVLAGKPLRRLHLPELGSSMTGEILRAFDEGTSLVSYIGHGGIHLWADENVFDTNDVESLAPQPQQPLLLTMNCLNGYFHFPYFDSLAEKLVKAEGRGAIAAFSPSGLSLNGPAHLFHQHLLGALFDQGHTRLGDAVLAAQEDYAATGAFPELLSIYHLLGDPALRLR
ncbi:MAG: C25 family cysteine peptidase, partial [Vicinamibacteria bacterium]